MKTSFYHDVTFRYTCTVCKSSIVFDKPLGTSDVAICSCCIYLEMVRRHALNQRLSLRDVVERYLVGTAKQLGVDKATLWKAHQG